MNIEHTLHVCVPIYTFKLYEIYIQRIKQTRIYDVISCRHMQDYVAVGRLVNLQRKKKLANWKSIGIEKKMKKKTFQHSSYRADCYGLNTNQNDRIYKHAYMQHSAKMMPEYLCNCASGTPHSTNTFNFSLLHFGIHA